MPWELNGNAGVGPQDFLGTRNNAPLIIRTNTNNAPANLEEVMRITPSSQVERGNVGVGTAAPLYRLHVTAPGGFGGEDANGVASQPGNVPIIAQSNSTAFGIINGSGRPAFALNIDGDGGTSGSRGVPSFYDRADGNWHRSLWLTNGTAASGQFITASDERTKTNVEQLTGMLDKLERIRGVTFDWNGSSKALGGIPGRRSMGTIAQEVEAVFPELIACYGDQAYKGVNYSGLTGVLVEAIKEMRAEVDALTRRVEALADANSG